MVKKITKLTLRVRIPNEDLTTFASFINDFYRLIISLVVKTLFRFILSFLLFFFFFFFVQDLCFCLQILTNKDCFPHN